MELEIDSEVKMRPELRKEIDNVADEYIDSTIERMAETGRMTQSYRLSSKDIGRDRIQARTAEGVVAALHSRGIKATYEDNSFTVTVDLAKAVLNRQQVSNEAVARKYYLAEHN